MNFGAYLLPAARKSDDQVKRYVRAEYREKGDSWFAATCVQGSCLRLPGEALEMKPVGIEEPRMAAEHPARETCCPVLNAIAESQLLKDLSPRGELSGRN